MARSRGAWIGPTEARIQGNREKGEWPPVRRRGCGTKEEGRVQTIPSRLRRREREGGRRREGRGEESWIEKEKLLFTLCPLEGLWPTTRGETKLLHHILIPGVHLCTWDTCKYAWSRRYVQGVSEKREYMENEIFFPLLLIILRWILINLIDDKVDGWDEE